MAWDIKARMGKLYVEEWQLLRTLISDGPGHQELYFERSLCKVMLWIPSTPIGGALQQIQFSTVQKLLAFGYLYAPEGAGCRYALTELGKQRAREHFGISIGAEHGEQVLSGQVLSGQEYGAAGPAHR